MQIELVFEVKAMYRVLLADDSLSQREWMTHILVQNGFSVKAVANGQDILEELQFSSPHLIILDIVMPNLNGFETCRRIKQNPNTQEIPVLFCSAMTTQADRYWGFKNGATAYLPKPFNQKNFLTTVQQTIVMNQLCLSRDAPSYQLKEY